MPALSDFTELCGVTKEGALNFWAFHLKEAIGNQRWSQIRDSTGIYLASVLGHFCLESIDRKEILLSDYNQNAREFRQFADLAQVAEMMLQQLKTANSPLWMESAGAHILLYAGFFYSQNRGRHNIDFFSRLGRDCYRMAAVGDKEKTMRLVARGFNEYLFFLSRLHKNLREEKYLIKL